MNKSSLFDQISEEKVKCKWIFTLIAVLCFSMISTERCLAIAYAITSDDGTTSSTTVISIINGLVLVRIRKNLVF